MQEAFWPGPSVYFAPQQAVWFGIVQSMQAFQSWQQLVNQYMQDVLSNSQLLDANGKTLEGALQIKQHADQTMEMAVSAMQMPTRSDIELLLAKLSTLESLVRDLNDKVDELIDTEQQL